MGKLKDDFVLIYDNKHISMKNIVRRLNALENKLKLLISYFEKSEQFDFRLK